MNGESQAGIGVYGVSHGGDGVFGEVLSANAAGVHGVGIELQSTGVWGQAGGASTALAPGLNAGVFGDGGSYVGVIGHSSASTGSTARPRAAGTAGWPEPTPARRAASGSPGTSTAGTGLSGTSTSGHGVVAAGGLAPLLLTPAATPGAPTSGAHSAGELVVDSHGVLFQCTMTGTPGTWVPVVTTGALLLGEANAATATTSVTTTTGNGLSGTTSADGRTGVAGADTSATGGPGCQGPRPPARRGRHLDGRHRHPRQRPGCGYRGEGREHRGLRPGGLRRPGPPGAHPRHVGRRPDDGRATLAGALYTDSTGPSSCVCAAGTPGTWAQLSAGTSYANGAFCLLPAPIRLLDTRSARPTPSPRLPCRSPGSGSYTLQVTGAVQHSIQVPTGAVAVIGNVTAVNAVAGAT